MSTKPFTDRWELQWVGAALLVLMLFVMWIQRPGATCTLSFEAPRLLELTRAGDRDHLTSVLGSADRSVRRYMLSTPDIDEQHRRFVDCKAALVEQIAARYGLSRDRVRAEAQ